MQAYLPATWVVILTGTVLWTTLFSFSSKPGIRGWRNLGLLASYAAAATMLVMAPLVAAASVWAAFGIAGGLFYHLQEWIVCSRGPREGVERPRAVTMVHGLLMWPLMVPEAVETLLTELGVLKAGPEPASPPA